MMVLGHGMYKQVHPGNKVSALGHVRWANMCPFCHMAVLECGRHMNRHAQVTAWQHWVKALV